MSDGTTGRVGPIIFSHDRARQYLINNGIVVTFRTDARTTGETHVRFERTGEKQFDARVVLLADRAHEGIDDALEEWYARAGFSSAEEWRRAIVDLNGAVPGEGYFYEVQAADNYREQLAINADLSGDDGASTPSSADLREDSEDE
jgi:hypothetical protein